MTLLQNTPKTSAEDALKFLEQAWSYFRPEPPHRLDDREPELFQYHHAA